MSYYQDLAQKLCRRGCEEDQVLAVLTEVRETTTAAGTSPESEFGTPEEKAAGYSGERKRSPGRFTLNIFGLLGLCCVAVYAIWPEIFGFTAPVLREFAGMIAMLVLLIIGAFAAGFVDTRLPKGFRE